MRINKILLDCEFGTYKVGDRVSLQYRDGTGFGEHTGIIVGIDSKDEPLEFRLRIKPFNNDDFVNVVNSDAVTFMKHISEHQFVSTGSAW